MFAAFDPFANDQNAQLREYAGIQKKAGNDRNKSALTAARAREPSSTTSDPIKSSVLHGKLFGSARAMYPSTK